ncbi:MAG: hypothetical protein ACM30I_15200 [Gemmatimonas sp.]
MERGSVGAPRSLDRIPARTGHRERSTMNGVIYLVGLVVVVLAILSFFGLR